MAHLFYLQRHSMILLLLLKLTTISAQTNHLDKPPIDTGALKGWTTLLAPILSSTGRYAAFVVNEVGNRTSTTVVTDSSGTWRKEFKDAHRICFSKDENLFIFEIRDSLCIAKLGTDTGYRYIPITSFWPSQQNNPEWIAYQGKGRSPQLTLLNLLNGNEKQLGRAARYLFAGSGSNILITDTLEGTTRLYLIEGATGYRKQIWEGQPGQGVVNFFFDNKGRQLIFLVQEKEGQRVVSSIWYYRMDQDSAELKLKDGDPRIDPDLCIAGNAMFSQNGQWIELELQERPRTAPKLNPDAVLVDVWSYKDPELQPEQVINERHEPKTFAAILGSTTNIYRQIEQGTDKMITSSLQIVGDQVVISHPDSTEHPDPTKHMSYPPLYYILSLKTGDKKLVRRKGSWDLSLFSLSSDDHWLIFYDEKSRNYFSYDIASGIERNLTAKLPARFSNDIPPDTQYPGVAAVAGWLKGDSSFFLHDNFDLWEIDPAQKRRPINVTAGFGTSHHIKLRRVEYPAELYRTFHFRPGDTLLLTGFNVTNKHNGLFKQILGHPGLLDTQAMGPYTYYRLQSQDAIEHSSDNGMLPLKAENARVWLIQRESASEAPNYYLTTDFRSFRLLSNNNPQAGYNWLTSELINYRQLDGSPGQGVLYKPENFDPHKKYPVILHYYQQLSHRVFEFLPPRLTQSNLNIPWFVSRGYLVFTPDIQYKQADLSGRTVGAWAYNSILGAAVTLTKLPYIDSKRMGLQGHSLGGMETNYLITHSTLFAAAAEMAGVSDLQSLYLTLVPSEDFQNEDDNMQSLIEKGQGRFGATLWQRPDLYLRESAVLQADKIKTPLLIIHNKNDDAVQWRQGVELYMALRRLQKKVWMLQYDNETHTIIEDKNALDYTIRLTQFFDHYLKGDPPPRWMTEGIPARSKGIDKGYDLDRSGRIP